MRFVLLVFLPAFIFCSCTIEQRFDFNNDFSGTFTQRIDYSQANEMMKGFEEEAGENTDDFNMLSDSTIAEVEYEISGIEGVELVSISDENYVISTVISFESLSSLNQLLKSDQSEEQDSDLHCVFEQDGKVMKVEFVVTNPERSSETSESDGMNSSEIQGMLNYRMLFSFSRDVKKVSGTPSSVLEDGKTVLVEQTMKDFSSPDFNRRLEITLK